MSLRQNKNQGASIGTSGLPKSQKTTKRVEDIILDKNHPAYTGPDSIGIIFFADEKTKEDTLDSTTLPRAKPLNLNFITTPSIGDLVHIESSVSDDYYSDLGGNSNFTSNYYTNAINVYNNAGSNAVPLNKKTKRKNKKDKTRESEPNFEFEKEFRADSRQAVNIKCDNYLIGLGYPSGRRDRKAPKYRIERASNGDYIRKLADSKRNKAKLGLYYEENRNQQNLSPSEGSTIFQGKDGQRFHALNTGPNGANAVSRNVTDVDDDGNSNIGDPAMILSLGRGDTENITYDAASIYMLANQGLPIDVACQLVDSTKSIYEKLLDPLAAIENPPPEVISEDDLETETETEEQVQDVFDFDSTEQLLEVLETSAIAPPPVEEPWDDPVFAALDDAQEEGLITFKDHIIPPQIFSSQRPTPKPPPPTPPTGEYNAIAYNTEYANSSDDPNYTPPTNMPAFYPPYPYTGPAPNADTLRDALDELGWQYREKVIDSLNIGELSNGGDITLELSNYGIAIFRKIKELMPTLKVVITGGNDQYHHKLEYTSRHSSGRGLDFVIDPPTKDNIKQVDTILRGFLAGNYPNASFLNEYDDPSVAATGRHFHVTWQSWGTEGNATKEEALIQAEEGEILTYTV